MKWTEPRKPTEGVSFYDHVERLTPEMIEEFLKQVDE